MSQVARVGVLLALAIMIALAGTVASAEARLAPSGDQYDRQAMVNEAVYAMRGPYCGPLWIGQWNYMASDPMAQRLVITKMGGVGRYSGWTADGIITGHPEYGFIDGKGRGGQCLFFVNLLLHRSESDKTSNQNNWNNIERHATSIEAAVPGDLVFRPRPGPHIAVVVYRSGNYISIVESNYRQPEIMAIRYTTVSTLRSQGYKTYTGVDYYYK